MTKDKALYTYLNNFMTAYPNTAAPIEAPFPFMTYEYTIGEFDSVPVMITASMWFKTDSEAVPNAEAERFRQYINDMDMIPCDDGAIWIRPGSPWCNSLNDQTDHSIKRRLINITIEYLTN